VLPETVLSSVLARVESRWQVRTIAHVVSVGGAVFAAVLILSSLGWALAAAAIAAAMMVTRSKRVTSVEAAQLIESAGAPLDNLVITASEVAANPRPIRSDVLQEIQRQAAERVRSIDPARVVPLTQPALVAAGVLAGCIALGTAGGDSIRTAVRALPSFASTATPDMTLTVRVTPPAYTKRNEDVLENPVQVTVIAGSRVRVESGRATLNDWVATRSEGLELRAPGSSAARFLSVIVVPDAPPLLRIVAPGKDTAFVEPSGQLAIAIESRDDLGLSSLALRFTKASGGGENVSFSEGEVSLRVERRSEQQWSGHADLSLAALSLADGDILVYRAIARDTNPAGAPVQSDQYLIEIGKSAMIADAGFALPTEERKFAISQQMVIYRTEQLLAARAKHRDDWLEQTRMIGMEQRMVRAEVVFLGGGEVQDEVEEAAHSHELSEGRLENTGRVEMLRAINLMSRAEAQLNDGRAAEALVFERQALASLERALDRRRYFLRTLPDRSRIDGTRRLTGERRDARSWTRDQAPAPASVLANHRRVISDLAASAGSGAGIDAAMAARVAAIDPASPELQSAAVAIASAVTDDARIQAARTAMHAITQHALTALPSSTALEFRADPLAGALSDELARKPRP
jgi:hypothetical protein